LNRFDTPPTGTDWAFAATHCARKTRSAFVVLGALDDALGRIVAGTTQSLIGQMRLTWWFEALTSLTPDSPSRHQPLLDSLRDDVIAGGRVCGGDLAALVEGWEVLLDPLPFDDAVLGEHATGRGRMFTLAAAVIGGAEDRDAGACWALADFAARCSDADTAARAWALARSHAAAAQPQRLARPLRILFRLAEGDARVGTRRPRGLRTGLTSLA